jgi:hypothetical protein
VPASKNGGQSRILGRVIAPLKDDDLEGEFGECAPEIWKAFLLLSHPRGERRVGNVVARGEVNQQIEVAVTSRVAPDAAAECEDGADARL